MDAVPQQVSPGVMDQFLHTALLDTAPDPGVDAFFTPNSLSLKPGSAGKVTLDLADERSTTAKTVSWKLDVPDGVTASPGEGSVTVPAGAPLPSRSP
ncbi:hypothetical protein WKI71_33940 [Streptomyces sp. MS1.AVA.1]|uniref:Uncharacterized protein n=1 Tax=Streptomyces machairae TaxID=3134109 RepID=A0ABU8UTM0_9ACTN